MSASLKNHAWSCAQRMRSNPSFKRTCLRQAAQVKRVGVEMHTKSFGVMICAIVLSGAAVAGDYAVRGTSRRTAPTWRPRWQRTRTTPSSTTTRPKTTSTRTPARWALLTRTRSRRSESRSSRAFAPSALGVATSGADFLSARHGPQRNRRSVRLNSTSRSGTSSCRISRSGVSGAVSCR